MAPIYPDEAAKQHVQDVVVLQVLVDETGRPRNIRLLRGSRKAPLLDGAAAAAVRQWTFSPARKNGQPVACWYNVGVQRLRTLDFAEAAEYFTNSLELQPKDEAARRSLDVAKRYRGRSADDALRIYIQNLSLRTLEDRP